MSITTGVLAQQIADLIERITGRDAQYGAWAGGTATGGPNGDGKYPLSDATGAVTLLPSPAALAASVLGPADQAKTSETNALAAAIAAKLSEDKSADHQSFSEAARGAAIDARDMAQIHRNHAGTHEANARYWAELAQGHGANSTADREIVELLAAQVQADAIDAEQYASDAAVSAALAATFNPSLYDLKSDTLAASRLTGLIDVARIPILPSQKQFASSGGLADLTTAQQNEIGQGSIVTTTDGRRYVYSGNGSSKTVEASYVVLADVTPDWQNIADKPSFFPSNIANVSGLQAALDGKASSYNPLFTGVLSGPNIAVRDTAGKYRSIKFHSGSQQRWGFLVDNSPESGAATGSDFYFLGHDNDETQWSVFSVQRSSKIMNVYSPTVFSGEMQASQGMHVGHGNVAHIYKDPSALSIRYGSSFWSFKDGGEFNTYQLRSIDGMRIGDTNRNRHLYQFSDQVVRMTIGGSYWHFDEFAGTFRSSRIRITDRLIWGEEGLDGFYFDGATMRLENDRNFNMGAGVLFCGRLQTSSNGAGDNIKLGDDVWIGDAHVANGVMIKGQQSPTEGHIKLGSSGHSLGFNGTHMSFRNHAGTETLAITSAGELHTRGATMFTADSHIWGWHRVEGNGGIYWQNHGGGWFMQDTTWLRSYNNKGILTTGTVQMGAFTVTSDRRIKSDFAPIKNTGSIIDQTAVYEFTKAGKRQLGVIAQEAQEIVPVLVSEGGELHTDGTPLLTVDMTGYIPILIEEVKGLRSRVAELEGR